jgi:hypothetical protein
MKQRIIKIDTRNASGGYVAVDLQYEGFWIVVGDDFREETVWIGEGEAARLIAAIRANLGTAFGGTAE